ncbi:hypothetical protein N7474_009901 [Penicillium riverlandense]|uniref:uncharacterized protein n=1 Tax=Penicillium riverlandense TaxID=1903569 RepID=UPI002548CDDC|nr:uncharacterized protein N7474_009901 [Penicillium riverlandense]KAJ5808632.1 hypothetical protein N7474_009901 [Penicillium riverlandense]
MEGILPSENLSAFEQASTHMRAPLSYNEDITKLMAASTTTTTTTTATTNSTPISNPDEVSGTTSQPRSRRSRHEPEPDWSEQVREQVRNSRRTGQACDRCKLRKMRCDPRPTGCAPCIAGGLPCQVTDRVTGETYVRGAASRMKKQINSLQAQIQQLRERNLALERRNELLEDQIEILCEQTARLKAGLVDR